jgi:hypothetical protein
MSKIPRSFEISMRGETYIKIKERARMQGNTLTHTLEYLIIGALAREENNVHKS